MAHDGTLESGKSLAEQQARAQKHLKKLMKLSFKKYAGMVIAHEYEHTNNLVQKQAILYAHILAPIIAEGLFLATLGSQISTDVGLGSLLATFAGMGLGATRGRALEEKASYEAGEQNAMRLASCFTINEAVFAKEILGENTKPSA